MRLEWPSAPAIRLYRWYVSFRRFECGFVMNWLAVVFRRQSIQCNCRLPNGDWLYQRAIKHCNACDIGRPYHANLRESCFEHAIQTSKYSLHLKYSFEVKRRLYWFKLNFNQDTCSQLTKWQSYKIWLRVPTPMVRIFQITIEWSLLKLVNDWCSFLVQQAILKLFNLRYGSISRSLHGDSYRFWGSTNPIELIHTT